MLVVNILNIYMGKGDCVNKLFLLQLLSCKILPIIIIIIRIIIILILILIYIYDIVYHWVNPYIYIIYVNKIERYL